MLTTAIESGEAKEEPELLLDADVLIDLERGHPNALAWFATRTSPFAPFVSGFAAMELLNGCRNKKDWRKVEKFLTPFPLLWPSEDAMQSALTTFTPLRLTHGLGMLDALVAATALEYSLALATFNVKHFRAVPGLTLAQPYKR